MGSESSETKQEIYDRYIGLGWTIKRANAIADFMVLITNSGYDSRNR